MPPRIPLRPQRSLIPRCQTRPLTTTSSRPQAGQNDSPNDSLDRLYTVSQNMASSLSAASPAAEAQRQSSMAESLDKIAEFGRAADLEKLQHRRWATGDVYAPHDLTSTEMEKFRVKQRPNQDAFDVLGVNPLDEYKVGSSESGGFLREADVPSRISR